jgi:hypothetical protein
MDPSPWKRDREPSARGPTGVSIHRLGTARQPATRASPTAPLALGRGVGLCPSRGLPRLACPWRFRLAANKRARWVPAVNRPGFGGPPRRSRPSQGLGAGPEEWSGSDGLPGARQGPPGMGPRAAAQGGGSGSGGRIGITAWRCERTASEQEVGHHVLVAGGAGPAGGLALGQADQLNDLEVSAAKTLY